MDAGRRHYYWDRLVRGVIRGTMTKAQRQSLCDEIVSYADDPDTDGSLVKAAEDFADGILSEPAVVAGFEANKVDGFDVEAFRAAQGIDMRAIRENERIEKRLAEVLGTGS